MIVNLKRMFIQPAFWLAAVLSMAGLTINVWPDMQTNWEVYISREYYSSALQFTIQPIYFGGFILMMVVAAAFPAAGSLVDDLREHVTLYEWSRLSKRSYLAIKALTASLCGGCAAALGFLLHAMFCYSLFLPSNPQVYQSHVLPYDGTLYEGLYSICGGLPMVLYVATAILLTGMVWALVGLACAAWIPDKVIAVAAPIMVYYLWLWGGVRELSPWLSLSPTVLFNDGLNLPALYGGLLQYALLGLGAFLVFRAGMNRRLCNG